MSGSSRPYGRLSRDTLKVLLWVLLCLWALSFFCLTQYADALAARPAVRIPLLLLFALLSALIGAASSGVAVKGVGRSRPTRVSDPQQQGDIVPATLVAGTSIYYAARAPESAAHAVFRYDIASGRPTQLHERTFPAVRFLQPSGEERERLLLVTAAGTVHRWTHPMGQAPGHYADIRPATPDDALSEVHALVVRAGGAFLLGTHGNEIVVCEIATDTDAYARLPGVYHTATTARDLRVSADGSVVSFVFSNRDGDGLIAWRHTDGEWQVLVATANAGWTVTESAIAGNEVYFGYGRKGAVTVWHSDGARAGGDLGINSPALFREEAGTLFFAGELRGQLGVFQAPARVGAYAEVPFGEGVPRAIHDIAIESPYSVRVLATHGSHSLFTLTVNNGFERLGNAGSASDPRALSSCKGSSCFVGDATDLYVFDAFLEGPYRAENVAGDAVAERLVVNGGDIFFVAKARQGELALFRSHA